MEFNLSGMHHVEPAFSGLAESPGSQVHGVAFKMSLESAENLIRNEGEDDAYDKKNGYASIIHWKRIRRIYFLE